MDPDGAEDGSQSRQGGPNDPEQAPPDHDSPPTDASSKARLSRKRTKTGCLTCRKRRIKCGEEQPVCKNCIKSKRSCEGYNSQRVLLHQPTYDYSAFPNGGAQIAFQSLPYPGQFVPHDAGYGGAFAAAPGQHPYPVGEHGQPILHYAAPNAFPPHPPPALQPHSTGEPVHGVPIIHLGEGRDVNAMLLTSAPPLVPYIGYPIPSSSAPTLEHASTLHHPMYLPRSAAHPPSLPPYMIPPRPVNTDLHSPAATAPFHSSPYGPSPTFDPQNRAWPSQYPPRSDSIHPDEPLPLPASAFHAGPATAPRTLPSQNVPSPELYQETREPFSADTTNTLLGQAAVETQDDNYYDIASDEEMDIDSSAVTGLAHEQLQKLHRILQVNNIRVHDLETRQHDGFLYEGILDHYRVEDAANPLRNPATARVFAHFIAVTGPCLSVFERRPRNTSVLFADGKVPFAQQGLWTYTMPVAALHHQGLLHSMLALASLHIARLQNASDTPSRQHYAWACKRINHLLGRNSKKRHQTTTIAASMLLGFYEILTADHRAWNMHLKGSKQLFLETDFVSLARKFRRMKREKEGHRVQAEGQHDTMSSPTGSTQDEILSQITDVDDAMVSSLFGSEVSYDGPVPKEEGVPQPLDLSNFEILKDLYWWYLKQDAYQSIISGNPLLLDYSQWADCPPRAPLGRFDAVYGSFDHLILLLGRIADFSARDRKRKLRQMEANGGQWRPAPGMSLPGTPRHSNPNTPTWVTPNGQPAPASSYFPPPQPSATIAQETPQFFGMAPPPRQGVQMPAAYNAPPAYPQQPPATSSPSFDEPDLKTATEQAMEEYGRLRAALLQFSRSLGPAFDPLTSEFQPPLDTPFGTALFYRSYDISCLWAIFHMAEIIAIRSHPHMHPAAHAAAAIASHQTAYQATEIGRITAALVPGPPDTALNPMLAAALCETCVPSFFAAVQYKNAQQRHATVSRIKYIAQRTGWGSAEVIANGCETAWVKAYEAGRGPPYTRIARSDVSEDPRLNGAWEKARPVKAEDDRGLVRTQAEARLQWAIGVLGMEEDVSSAF